MATMGILFGGRRMKLYWRYKKDEKWSWKPVKQERVKACLNYATITNDHSWYRWEEEE
tara:strand:- start:1814 stop:1987 length:174 start_codon:yes stop_codon:yes gene_type:complete